MRKRVEPCRGVRYLDLLQQFQCPCTSHFAAAPLVVGTVDAQRLGELKRDGEARVQTRQRILEDHGDVLADQGAAFRAG